MSTFPRRFAAPLAVLATFCLVGCPEDEIAGVTPKTKKATPAPTVSGGIQTGDATPDPAQVSSGISTAQPTVTLPTNPPVYVQPTPSPTPLATLGQPLTVSGGPRSFAFAGTGGTWILRAGDIAPLSASSAGALGTSPVGTPYSTGLSQPSFLAAVPSGLGADLWIVSSGSARVDQVATSPNVRFVASMSIAVNPAGLAADTAQVWIAHRGGSLTRIATATGASQTFALPATPNAIALSSTHAWVAATDNVLYQVSRADGAVAATYSVGANPVAVALDSAGAVWTANRTGQSLSKVSAGSVQTYALAGDSPVSLVAQGSRLWVACAGPNKVRYFGLDGTAQGSVTLPLSPVSITYDPAGKVWVADPTGNKVVSLTAQ